jgi:phospholipid N-methyltransferase
MSESSQNKTISDFVTLKQRAGLVHAIRAATELGVFEALSGGQLTAEQIAGKIEADTKRVESLMAVLSRCELVEQYDDHFALSMLARLIPSNYFDLGDSHWQNLVDNVRSGKPLEKGKVVDDSDADFLVQQASEEWMLTPAALTVAQILDIGNSRRGLNILELGCGSAVFSATLAHADPTSTLTLVDTQPEIARAKTTCDSVQILSRTTFIEAKDWRDIEVIDLTDAPADDETSMVAQPTFDLVIVHKKVHLNRLNRTAGLMKKLGALLLNRGGELAIIDVFPGQDKGDACREIFELEFGLRHSHGRCHHPRDLEPALKAAGFANVQFAHLPAEPFLYGLILAAKG